MANGEFLRLVYDDANMLALICKHTGKAVHKIKYDSGAWAEYKDEFGIVIASAEEVTHHINYPYVKVHISMLENPGRVDIQTNIYKIPTGKVRFVSNQYSGESYYDVETLKKLDPERHNTGTTGGSGGTGGTGGSGSTGSTAGGGCSTVLGVILLIVGIFLCGVISKLLTETFSGLYYYAYDMLGMIQLGVTKLACPVALVLCLLFLRVPKNCGAGVRVFYVFLLLFTAATCVPIAIQLDRMLQPFGYGIQGSNNVKFFLMSFAPGLAYAAVLRILIFLTRKSENSGSLRTLALKACKVQVIFTGVLVFVARMTAAYVWQFSLDFSDGMFFVFRALWYVVLIVAISHLPLAIVGE